jgi:hypothetical protein
MTNLQLSYAPGIKPLLSINLNPTEMFGVLTITDFKFSFLSKA